MNFPWHQLQKIGDNIARVVAWRDLDGLPIYFLAASRFAAEPSACHGYCHERLDLHLQRTIGRDWRGRGPCVVVDDRAIVADVGAGPEDAEFVEHAVRGVILHELAHALEQGWPDRLRCGEQVDPVRVQGERKRLVAIAARPSSGRGNGIAAREWLAHRPDRFVRVLCHLRRRAELLLGIRLPEAWLSRRPGVARLDWYQAALGSEVERMIDATFAQILSEPLAPEFDMLWRQDLELFHNYMFPQRRSVMSMIDLSSALAERKAEKESAYGNIAAAISRDEEVVPEDVEIILRDCGKTEADLQAEVSRLQEVARYRTARATAHDAQRQYDAQTAEAEALLRIEMERRASFDKEQATRNLSISALQSQIQAGKAAEQALRRLAPQEIKDALKSNTLKLDGIRAERDNLRRQQRVHQARGIPTDKLSIAIAQLETEANAVQRAQDELLAEVMA